MNFFLRNPLKSDILVFDELNYQYLKKVIPSRHSVTIINQRPQEIFVSIKILKKLICIFLKRFSIKKSLKKSLKESYYESLILTLNPKAVVTLIDNNKTFNYLSKTIKTIPFIAIQNGLRHPFEGSSGTFHVQHYFSFGENEKKYFPKYKMEVENYYPAGSLLNSIFSSNNTEDKIFDILIVSCWRGNIGYGKDVKDSMNSMLTFDNLLSNYISKRKLKVAVILRSKRGGEHWFMPEINMNEEQYFKNIYHKNIKIFDFDPKNRNIYDLILKSELILSSFGTTTLLEAYGNGKKILYSIFCDDKVYHEIFDDSIVFTNSESKYFEDKLDEIISIDKNEYYRQHNKNMEYYMSKSKLETTNFIKSKIKEIISNHYVSIK